MQPTELSAPDEPVSGTEFGDGETDILEASLVPPQLVSDSSAVAIDDESWTDSSEDGEVEERLQALAEPEEDLSLLLGPQDFGLLWETEKYLIVHILEFLDFVSLMSLGRSCRRVRGLSQHDSVWKIQLRRLFRRHPPLYRELEARQDWSLDGEAATDVPARRVDDIGSASFTGTMSDRSTSPPSPREDLSPSMFRSLILTASEMYGIPLGEPNTGTLREIYLRMAFKTRISRIERRRRVDRCACWDRFFLIFYPLAIGLFGFFIVICASLRGDNLYSSTDTSLGKTVFPDGFFVGCGVALFLSIVLNLVMTIASFCRKWAMWGPRPSLIFDLSVFVLSWLLGFLAPILVMCIYGSSMAGVDFSYGLSFSHASLVVYEVIVLTYCLTICCCRRCSCYANHGAFLTRRSKIIIPLSLVATAGIVVQVTLVGLYLDGDITSPYFPLAVLPAIIVWTGGTLFAVVLLIVACVKTKVIVRCTKPIISAWFFGAGWLLIGTYGLLMILKLSGAAPGIPFLAAHCVAILGVFLFWLTLWHHLETFIRYGFYGLYRGLGPKLGVNAMEYYASFNCVRCSDAKDLCKWLKEHWL